MNERQPTNPKARRGRRWLLLALALVLLYFLTPAALTWLASLLVRQDPLQPADVVIVLGGGRHCLRLQYGAELYRKQFARKLVLSGIEAPTGSTAEGNVPQRAIRQGVAEADIQVVKNTWHTRAEAEELTSLMRAQGWRSALIVTDPSHTRRAHYILQRAAPELAFAAAPVPQEWPQVWRAERWWTRRGDMRYTLREFLSWLNLLVGGLT
jgi:uncharacterized SAM-binding protein YcdF (DUF218 family)